jgi:uncharacterized protein
MTPGVEELSKKVAPALRKRGVRRAFVFGSFARGDAKAGSDVDFLVEFEKGRTLLDLAGLHRELEEILGRAVDVVTPDALHPRLKEGILRELVPIL